MALYKCYLTYWWILSSKRRLICSALPRKLSLGFQIQVCCLLLSKLLSITHSKHLFTAYVTEWIIQQDNINRLLQAVSAEPTEKYLRTHSFCYSLVCLSLLLLQRTENYLMLLAHLSSGSSKMKLREIMVAQNMLPTIMRLAENSKSAIIARYCATLTGLLSTQQQTQTS